MSKEGIITFRLGDGINILGQGKNVWGNLFDNKGDSNYSEGHIVNMMSQTKETLLEDLEIIKSSER